MTTSAGHGQPVLEEEQDHRGVDHQPVGERVGVLAELRLDVPAPREPAVDLIGDRRRRAKTIAAGQLWPSSAAREEHDEDRDRARTARSSARSAAARAVRRRRGRSRSRIVPPSPVRTRENPAVADASLCPGFVNAHSHAFQRALRGRAEGGDFWAWREAMLAEAERQTPETRPGRRTSATYRELLAAGYTAVGEFHYLGFDEALAAAEAAAEAGIDARAPPRRVRARRARALPPGVGRRRTSSEVEALASARACASALAPHSVRACPADWLEEIGALRRARAASRSTSTRASSRARSRSASPSTACGRSSSSRDTGCLGPRTTIVHATHASDGELDLARGRRRARLHLPDDRGGPRRRLRARSARLRERGIALCIGSDSNVRIDPLEELRELDGIARRAALRRDVISARRAARDRLATNGAAALGLDAWPRLDDRPRAPVAARRRAGRRPGRARRRLLSRRRHRRDLGARSDASQRPRAAIRRVQYAVRSRYARSAALPYSPYAPS